PLPRQAKRIFLDITATCRHDLKTGIERVARALTMAMLESPPAGYRIEPVYLSQVSGVWHHRHARDYTMDLMKCSTGVLPDEIVHARNGDLLLTLDISGDLLVCAERAGLVKRYRDQGVSAYAVVYDLLPIQRPDVFPPGAAETHAQ